MENFVPLLLNGLEGPTIVQPEPDSYESGQKMAASRRQPVLELELELVSHRTVVLDDERIDEKVKQTEAWPEESRAGRSKAKQSKSSQRY